MIAAVCAYKTVTPRQQVEGYDFNDRHNDRAYQRKAQDKNKPKKHQHSEFKHIHYGLEVTNYF